MSKITEQQIWELTSFDAPRTDEVMKLIDAREAEIREEYRELVEAARLTLEIGYIQHSLDVAIKKHLPRKPRTGDVIFSKSGLVLDQEQYLAVELTPEVEAALQQAGVEI